VNHSQGKWNFLLLKVHNFAKMNFWKKIYFDSVLWSWEKLIKGKKGGQKSRETVSKEDTVQSCSGRQSTVTKSKQSPSGTGFCMTRHWRLKSLQTRALTFRKLEDHGMCISSRISTRMQGQSAPRTQRGTKEWQCGLRKMSLFWLFYIFIRILY